MKKLVIALFVFAMLAGCSSNGGGNPAGDGYKIGLHYELTGEVADYGNAELEGSKLAIKLMNQKLGEDKYESVEYDNTSSTTESVTIATKLAQDGVIGVVGPATSGASAASYQVLDGAGIPVISPSATANNVTQKNPDDENSEVYNSVFRICF